MDDRCGAIGLGRLEEVLVHLKLAELARTPRSALLLRCSRLDSARHAQVVVACGTREEEWAGIGDGHAAAVADQCAARIGGDLGERVALEAARPASHRANGARAKRVRYDCWSDP